MAKYNTCKNTLQTVSMCKQILSKIEAASSANGIILRLLLSVCIKFGHLTMWIFSFKNEEDEEEEGAGIRQVSKTI